MRMGFFILHTMVIILLAKTTRLDCSLKTHGDYFTCSQNVTNGVRTFRVADSDWINSSVSKLLRTLPMS